MSAEEINDGDTITARIPDMDDMRYLTALRDQMAYNAPGRDGYSYTPTDMGYRPSAPSDPRWLWVLTIAVLLIAAASVPLILFGGQS